MKRFIQWSFIFFGLNILLLPGSNGQSCQVLGQTHYMYEDIKSILDKNACNSCHFKGSFQSSWHYDSYEAMFTNDNCGNPIVNRSLVNNSALIDKINGGSTSCGHSMPLNNKKVSEDDLLAIESWIQYGAPEYCLSIFSDIKTILDENKCNSCHIASDPMTWSYETYDHIIKKGSSTLCSEKIIDKYSAQTSFLYKKIIKSNQKLCGAPMLVEGEFMNDVHIAKIRDWINAGALTNTFILPVSLSQFDVKLNNKGNPILSWKTKSEFNTTFFEVQHSIDGIVFSTIDKIEAKNQNGADYFFEHKNQDIGFHYYRLNIIDNDNSSKFSQTRVIRIENDEELLNIFPTVLSASKYATLSVSWYPTSNREATYLNVMDISGRQCIKEKILIGFNFVDVSNLKPGLYYLTVQDFSGLITVKRIVITH